jgi:hypoxanthine phosphoribosyltransferase
LYGASTIRTEVPESRVEYVQNFSTDTTSLSVPFAHSSERDFAELLSFYGIQWLYEAVCFPLTRDPAGNVAESFTPDFYLPEYSVYVEVTTLKQKLVTRKNRKIRMFRELYPEINLVIIYRRNFESLLLRLGLQ